MNKTITINLGGINFYIDEIAYHKLDNYLKAISASLDPESRKETMDDIEARIAELFLKEQNDKNEVIGQDMVDNIIAVMGQPEDYQVDDEDAPRTSHQTISTVKKLYRDVEHRTIGGVCAGLGHYLNISRIIIRAILLFLLVFPTLMYDEDFLGITPTTFIIYIILWILVPAARTTSEKLEMQGEKINVDNIERKVREEYHKVKHNVQNANYSGIEQFFKGLEGLLMTLGKILVKIIGVLLILFGVFGILSLIFGAGFLPAYGLGFFTAYTGIPHWLTFIALFLFLGIPLFLVFLLGLKLLSQNLKTIGVAALVILIGIWVLSIAPIIIAGVNWSRKDYKSISSKTLKYPEIEKIDTLRIAPYGVSLQKSFGFKGGNFSYKSSLGRKVTFRIFPADKKPGLEVSKSIAIKGANEINTKDFSYPSKLKKDTLFLSKVLVIKLDTPFEDIEKQQTDIRLYLSENTVFSIDKELVGITDNIPESYFGHLLKYSKNKLDCLDCNKSATETVTAMDSIQKTDTLNIQQKKDSIGSEWYQGH